MDEVWIKPYMSPALRARHKARLSKPSDHCVQRLAIKRQDDCGKKRDSRGDDPTTNRPKPTDGKQPGELDFNARLKKETFSCSHLVRFRVAPLSAKADQMVW